MVMQPDEDGDEDVDFVPLRCKTCGSTEVRCFRTLKNLWPHIEPAKRTGTHHNALDDAIWQTEHIFTIRRSLRGNP